MATVHDVAAYIIESTGPISAMKLQKLCYYSKAWHQVWDDEPLFDERIEAWANGPVIPELYRLHRGEFRVAAWPMGRSGNLTVDERSSIDAVIESYGSFSAFQLSEMTHNEQPWIDARSGIAEGVRSNAEITPTSMHAYYLEVAQSK